MRFSVAATLTLVVGLFVANMLGVATAEAPTVTSTRTLSVQGVATVPIGQRDSAAEATAVYRQGQAAAVADGQSKAEFLAGKVGSAPGAIQSVIEGGGYIECNGGEESEYASYEGGQPDFGNGPQPSVAAPTSASAPAVAHVKRGKVKHAKRKRPTAKKAASVSCVLTAQVSLIYAIA
jgi:hypothetical protein